MIGENGANHHPITDDWSPTTITVFVEYTRPGLALANLRLRSLPMFSPLQNGSKTNPPLVVV